MTEELFRENAYLQSCKAKVVAIDNLGVVLDRTNFYPTGGGQPGDCGVLQLLGGEKIDIVDTIKSHENQLHYHVPAEFPSALKVGDAVDAIIDWDRRYRFMRMHTALHLLCSIVVGKITGCQIGLQKSRLDFDLGEEKPDKLLIQRELNDLVKLDYPVSASWVTDSELGSNPELIRNLSVKPPLGNGQVRLIEIKHLDRQPCGGTHVLRIGEIGMVEIGKIENKGKRNRRINLHFSKV